MPPKSFPNAFCHTSAVAGSCIILLKTEDSATRDGVHHGVGIMFHANLHLGMLHEHAGCVYCAEGGLLVEGEYINGVSHDDALLCAALNRCVHRV